MLDQELKKNLCGEHQACGLKRYVSENRGDFETLRKHLKSIAKPDFETQKRIRSLRELYRVKNRDFKSDDCYGCGDAIIAHECPADCAVVSNNKKHFDGICAVFTKKVVYFEN